LYVDEAKPRPNNNRDSGFFDGMLGISVTEGRAAGTIEAAMDIHGRGRGCRFGV